VKAILAVLLVLIVLLGMIGFYAIFGVANTLKIILILLLLTGLFWKVLPRLLGRINAAIWIALGLLLFAGLFLPIPITVAEPAPVLIWSPLWTILFFWPSLALVGSALLLHIGLSHSLAKEDSIPSDGGNPFWARINQPKNLTVVSLALSAILLIKTLHSLYWLTAWDAAGDSIDFFLLIMPTFATMISGFMLFLTLPEKFKIAGIGYIVLVPLIMGAVSISAQGYDYRQVTTNRAERIARKIELYYKREGSYPEALSQLSPWYILSLPKPMIIYGQDWCYEGRDDYYRLGYIDREHWSDPRLIGRVYKSVGDIPDIQKICFREFTRLQNDFPDYPFSFSAAVSQE